MKNFKLKGHLKLEVSKTSPLQFLPVEGSGNYSSLTSLTSFSIHDIFSTSRMAVFNIKKAVEKKPVFVYNMMQDKFFMMRSNQLFDPTVLKISPQNQTIDMFIFEDKKSIDVGLMEMILSRSCPAEVRYLLNELKAKNSANKGLIY